MTAETLGDRNRAAIRAILAGIAPLGTRIIRNATGNATLLDRMRHRNLIINLIRCGPISSQRKGGGVNRVINRVIKLLIVCLSRHGRLAVIWTAAFSDKYAP